MALLLLLLGGCATVASVGLRHRETGRTVWCEGYWHWNLDVKKAQAEEARQRRCIEEHEQKGYVRL